MTGQITPSPLGSRPPNGKLTHYHWPHQDHPVNWVARDSGGLLHHDVYQLVGDGDDADYLFGGDGLMDFRVGQGKLLEIVF